MSNTPVRPELPSEEQFRFWSCQRTRNRDTDQFHHVNHAAMATLFEEGRIEAIFAPEIIAEMRGIDLVVASLTMHFHKELKAPGNVRVGLAVSRIGSASLEIRQAIFAGELCYASAKAVCVFIGSASRRPLAVSPAVRKHLMGE